MTPVPMEKAFRNDGIKIYPNADQFILTPTLTAGNPDTYDLAEFINGTIFLTIIDFQIIDGINRVRVSFGTAEGSRLVSKKFVEPKQMKYLGDVVTNLLNQMYRELKSLYKYQDGPPIGACKSSEELYKTFKDAIDYAIDEVGFSRGIEFLQCWRDNYSTLDDFWEDFKPWCDRRRAQETKVKNQAREE